jgi:hypothetical protein
VPRIRDVEAFAERNLVLLLRHQPSEVDLDLSLAWTAFEREALAARESTRYGKVWAPMASVEALLVFKAIAGRARDIDDAVTLLTLYPNTDLANVRRRVVELAELAEAPELTLGLDEIVRVGAVPSGVTKRRRRASAPQASAKPKPKKKAATTKATKRRAKHRKRR